MTNEEAIKTLEANYPDACFEQLREAVDAAIEALKAQDADSDTISRKAAIDAILAVTGNSSVRELYEHVQEHGLSEMWSGGVNAAIDIIIAVPPAQPEKRTEERMETHGVCLDAIDRKAAIDAVMEFMPSLTTPDGSGQFDREIFEAQEMFIDIGQALNELPSAQPERQKGEWIDYTEDGYVECPFCHSATNCDGNKDELHFCFSCGADMRGEQDG